MTADSTRRTTAAPPGATSITYPVGKFIMWRSTMLCRFTTFTAALKTMGRKAGHRATIYRAGIRTSDWITVGGGDGMQSRVDPEDPNIVYSSAQNAAVSRLDKRTGVSTSIRPNVGQGQPSVRWNWDTPYIISPHAASRIYMAGSRVFRSDDRGGNWKSISGDLTRQIDRDTIPVMGRVWGSEAVTKNLFTTDYGVSTALCESPLKEGLLYVGTDDGLVQVSSDGGKEWRKTESFPGVPDKTFVSDLYASQHDSDTVYAAFNNYQFGDFKPYLLKSTDRGKTWNSIADNLPERHPVWCIVEDCANKDLLFAGTEFGLFFSIDGGRAWTELRGGMPTIAVRDLEIQRRENDLVCATFGRGFFILDDYSPLRGLTAETLMQEGAMLPLRRAYLYRELGYVRAAQGNFAASNPPFGAPLSYYLREDLSKNEAKIILTVTDANGKTVRTLNGPMTAGVHRVYWDLRDEAHAAPRGGGGRGGFGAGEQETRDEEEEEEEAEAQSDPKSELQREAEQEGAPQTPRRGAGRGGAPASDQMVSPGEYRVGLAKQVGGATTALGQLQSFNVVPLPMSISSIQDTPLSVPLPGR